MRSRVYLPNYPSPWNRLNKRDTKPMRSDHTRCPIEVSLMLKTISAQYTHEQSIEHDHISAIHWWTQRLLTAMPAPNADWQPWSNPCHPNIQPMVDLSVKESVLQFNPQGRVEVEE
jgi:hypothetical protein